MTRRWAALLLLGGCAPTLGGAGDQSPLTGHERNVEPVHVQPVWRRVLREGELFREKPRELAAAAYEPRGDRLGIGSTAGEFLCLRGSDGTTLWSAQVPGGVSGAAVFDGGRLITGTDDGQVLAFNAMSGRELWKYKVQGAVAQAPVFAGDLIFFVDGTNSIYAVSRSDGTWRWQYRRDLPADFAFVGEARPLVASGRAFVGFSDGHVVALQANDGAVLWTKDLAPEHERFQDVDATPVLIRDTLYAASAASGLHALDPARGDVRWSVPIPGILGMARWGGDLILSTERGQVLRVSGDDGRLRWQTRFEDGAPGAPVRAGKYIAVSLTQGGLYFLDPRTGRPVQRFTPGQGIDADPAVGEDGSVYVLSNGGILYAFR